MRYPILLEPGDDKFATGVVVPDLPGCFSAGDAFVEAFENAHEAIELWVEGTLEDGRDIPKPSTLDEIRSQPGHRGWILSSVDVDIEGLLRRAGRV